MGNHHDETRRSIMKGAAVLGAATLARGVSMASQQSSQPNQQNPPVSSGELVAASSPGQNRHHGFGLALGGYHLGSTKNQQEANDIVAKAMDAGVIFFDNAWDYHQGQAKPYSATRSKASAIAPS